MVSVKKDYTGHKFGSWTVIKKVEITIKDIWDMYINQNMKCVLSGVDIKFVKESRKKTTVSVDRIDSNGDYTLDNIQLIHKILNIMKGALPDQDFIKWSKLIAKNNE